MSLTDTKIRTAKQQKKEYKLVDIDGLFIIVKPNGSKLWRLRYYFNKKEYLLSLGPYPAISLLDARKRKDEYRRLLAKDINPVDERKKQLDTKSNRYSFENIAKEWCESQRAWSLPHKNRVIRSLELDLFPFIGDKAIGILKTRELLEPIKNVERTGRAELATRLQQRTNSIMRYAIQNGYIDYNPAQDLTGCVSKPKVVHRPALELERLPELFLKIENYKGRLLTKLALQLTLLIFIRSSELRFARWAEIDFDKRIWIIPAERKAIDGVKHSHRGSKMKTPHLVPLSEQAIAVLKQIYKISGNYELIFIGDNDPYKVMSEATINHALRRMGFNTKTELCCHGFRTMACSALVESSLWSRDAIERQMSHQERNGVRAAYIHKAEHISERFKMVQWWADYLDTIKNGFIMPYEFKAA